MSSQTYRVTYFGLPLRTALLQWVLVRTFCFTVRLLEQMEIPGGGLPPAHVQMLRHISHALYEQIRILQSPIYYGPNQWP